MDSKTYLDMVNDAIERPVVTWLETLDDTTLETITLSFGLNRDRVIVFAAFAIIVAGVVANVFVSPIVHLICAFEVSSCLIGDVARRFATENGGES